MSSSNNQKLPFMTSVMFALAVIAVLIWSAVMGLLGVWVATKLLTELGML